MHDPLKKLFRGGPEELEPGNLKSAEITQFLLARTDDLLDARDATELDCLYRTVYDLFVLLEASPPDDLPLVDIMEYISLIGDAVETESTDDPDTAAFLLQYRADLGVRP